MRDVFAPSAEELRSAAVPSGIGVSTAPTGGQGLALDEFGQVPLVVRKLLPGYELAYAEFVADVTVNSTDHLNPVDVVSSGAVAYDGAAVWVEFGGMPETGAAGQVRVALWDDTTELGWFVAATYTGSVQGDLPVTFKRKVTPSVGIHTYMWRAFYVTAAGAILAGDGALNHKLPGYIRVTRA